MDLATLLDSLNSVIAIPIVPLRGGAVDFDGHRLNIRYLMENNHLDNGRKRVISVAGTSLLHHLSLEDQNGLFAATGEVMGNDGILMSAVVPNPLADARCQIRAHLDLGRRPDVILIMPLTGVFSPEGLCQGLGELAEEFGGEGARFLYYLRASRDRDAVLQLMADSRHFVGVKVGTDVEDAAYMAERAPDDTIVIWGIGDRSTAAAEKGTKGHTSGTAVVVTRTADEINNAQRAGDWDRALEWEGYIQALEDIRFRNGRAFNYTAVIEALNQIGGDVTGGEGGFFNPPADSALQAEVKEAIAAMAPLH